ncbi:MAG: ADP-ribosylglycohydrolase family protein [Treponema sp.]|nr:ADP-ribosylglycohydrolase family protein [Treponema sp.]
MNTIWRTLSETVLIELDQSADEGREVRAFADEARQIFDTYTAGQLREEEAKRLIDKIRSAPIRADYSYSEPAGLDDIKRQRPAYHFAAAAGAGSSACYDKVYGAWLGRCAGCLLGQPVEGWRRERIIGMAKDTSNYPINRYFSSDAEEGIRARYNIQDKGHVYGSGKINWINNVSFMPEDDDTNYTILYLRTLEDFGLGFSSDDVATSWLQNVPIFHVCTAERVAYRNLVNLIAPPLSGSWYNPYREWVGAQIRADFFGYVNPGNTEQAAEFAWRDGRVSHVKNGIYGEMFCAAMLARAAVSSDVDEIIRAGLGELPQKSRLTESIEAVRKWRAENISWEAALNRLYENWDEKNSHHWCHVISNAMICAIALLWGGGDFEKTIGIAVAAGFDTDCNAATTGSIIGMTLGADKMPEKWTKPLNNKIKSGIDGFGVTEISELAERTVKLALYSQV